MFGAGDPTLWTHEQLTDETHEWTKGEFGAAPLTFFKQISKCVQAGHLLSVEGRQSCPRVRRAGAPDRRALLLHHRRRQPLVRPREPAAHVRVVRPARARPPLAGWRRRSSGRWPNGAPLSTHPESPGGEFDAAAPGANDFRYGDDLHGRRCPIGARIRRYNPRDALGHDGAMSMRDRMIRRGMPYGPPLADGELDDDGAERGLVVVSFQASIARQFEGLKGLWLSDGNIFGLGHDKDYLLGDATGAGKMTTQGERPYFLAPQRQLVTTRGAQYLFVPGMAALRALADGVAGLMKGSRP